MSCEILTISTIPNLKQIRKLLFPEWEDKKDVSGNWQDIDWSWKGDNESLESDKDDSWLQDCLISISPIGDVLVIANEDTAVFLILKWDGSPEQGTNEKFIVHGTESLPASEEFDGITSIMILPLASQKRSSYGRPDWTAVIIGTRLGYVRFYTENGILLVSQKFHEEPVTSIKCRTFDNHLCAALAEQQEELTILYKKAIVTIDGFSVYQTLRACRNQVAKATARGADSIAPPPISYKKWGFLDQEQIRDCESIGVNYTNNFDSLMNESIQHGSYGQSRITSPASSLFLTTGQSPYASFYYAVEGSAPFLMKDVALAAASKLKSVLTNFFGSSKLPADKSVPKIEPATSLPNRFEIRDASRLGEKIFTSPNRRLSAITDEFGRVILIDNWEGVAVRVWKGYRDAQCGWIEVCEDTVENTEGKGHPPILPRIANFFVIYGPRRGILEIWATQQGPRVAAFNVGKQSKLIYCNHGILGLTNVKSVLDSKLHTRNCYFLDSDGFIRAINIPFHYALSAQYSRRVRDLHLINKLKTYLKNAAEQNNEFISEVTSIILDIKTTSIVLQALDVLVSDKHATSSLLKFVFIKLKDLLVSQDPDSMDFESKLLYISCIRNLQLLEFYDHITEFASSSVIHSDDENDMKPLRVLSGIFNVPETEVDLILSRIDKFFNYSQKKSVQFETNGVMTAGQFLSCFQTYDTHLPKLTTLSDVELPLSISLATTTEIQLNTLACTVFYFITKGNINISDLQNLLVQSGIEMKTLLNLLLKCWLEKKQGFGDHKSLNNLYKVLVFICSHEEILESVVDCSDVSPLWKSVRSMFSSSTNIAAAYMGALTCRGVAIFLYTTHKTMIPGIDPDQIDNLNDGVPAGDRGSPKSLDNSLTEWETLNLDIEHWNLLVKQLEDTVVLCTLLYYKLSSTMISQSSYFYTCTDEPISVLSILEKGKGAISELVAKWSSCLHMDALVELGILSNSDQTEVYFFFHQDEFRDLKNDVYRSNVSDLKFCIESAQNHFPQSLNSDVWVANCCWEFAALWNKDKDCIEYLINTIKCLRQVSSSDYGKGLGVMLWHTFMRSSFYSAAALIEKVGKFPKDRLCRKEVGMNDMSLKKFIGCSLALFDILWQQMSSARFSSRLSTFICEESWQTDVSNSSLVDIIVSLKEPNCDLVCHHYKLAMTMHMILTFEMKSVKPLSLHGSTSAKLIGKDLNAAIFIPQRSMLPPSVIDKQTQFLCRVISLSVSSVSLPNFDHNEGATLSDFALIEQSRSRHWIGKITELANLWELDCDRLTRHYICELYNSGFDTFAEEILPTVKDRELMGSQLILMAGQRIYNAIQACEEKYVELMSLFSPLVTAWFTTLNQNSLRCPNPPLSMTSTIIGYVINVTPERGAEHRLAMSLIEPLHQLINTLENSKIS